MTPADMRTVKTRGQTARLPKRMLTPIERFMIPNPQWQEGYEAFSALFGKPVGWLVLLDDREQHRLIRLDRKQNCPFFCKSAENERQCESFITKFTDQLLHNEEMIEKLPLFYRCAYAKNCLAFPIRYLGALKGFLFFDCVKYPEKDLKKNLQPFFSFLCSQVDLAYKNFELNNFYETVHPRALALTTMHSVHRVINSSLRLRDLLPRIGRLSAQILKAQGCSIMLTDPERRYLNPVFSFGSFPKFLHRQRVRIGHGIEGRIADTGEFCLQKRYIAVPFIEDDVVGVLVLWDKADRQSFTRTDLEILKSLSEQAVVAIKNAQLFEQTEELTLGSIKTINELLERHFGEKRSHLEVVGHIAVEVGKKLELSGQELVHIERAILLLDTGQLGMPDRSWEKKEKLSQRDLARVRSIPLRGASLLKSMTSLKPIIPIIMHHHERFDGRGYPKGLKGEEIPIGARIVAVVDAFIAMVSKRPYKPQLSIQDATKEIRKHKGSQFDPEVVDAFLATMKEPHIIEKIKQFTSSEA
ncbi:MAG TPA: HD domain-containing phosphohydrolase [Candidatus Omnitrophota bacterium]|jgi:HD-GYP domain-containing protein (c-di-GMP phosphodiesterase class II)|nr:MAG: Cyclic di-GMP phosphodiesterase response regulator RpfG [Candidatus Omnitrophica bacterium ADurb.Bin314]HOE68103.1 HD domain-containing phosphohydrolase [Candidatus Omnitrophota bacterium]HQB94664.1 HD domain-containing phosphohydrolase [Candidatus Omnitrophota bacterium]